MKNVVSYFLDHLVDWCEASRRN